MNITMDLYLKSLGIELWPGEAFYLTDPQSRADAAAWVEELLRGYDEFVMRNTQHGKDDHGLYV